MANTPFLVFFFALDMKLRHFVYDALSRLDEIMLRCWHPSTGSRACLTSHLFKCSLARRCACRELREDLRAYGEDRTLKKYKWLLNFEACSFTVTDPSSFGSAGFRFIPPEHEAFVKGSSLTFLDPSRDVKMIDLFYEFYGEILNRSKVIHESCSENEKELTNFGRLKQSLWAIYRKAGEELKETELDDVLRKDLKSYFLGCAETEAGTKIAPTIFGTESIGKVQRCFSDDDVISDDDVKIEILISFTNSELAHAFGLMSDFVFCLCKCATLEVDVDNL